MHKVCVNPVNNLFSSQVFLYSETTEGGFIPNLSIGLLTDNSQVDSFFTQPGKSTLTDVSSFFSTLYTELITITTFYIKIINNPDRGIK